MKRMLLIGVVLLIGLSSHSQSKQVYCDFYEQILEASYAGVRVDYTGSTLEIVIPITEFAEGAEMSTSETRELLQYKSSMDLIGESFIYELSKEKAIFNEQGFYYVILKIKDNYYHDYKLYSTKKMRI